MSAFIARSWPLSYVQKREQPEQLARPPVSSTVLNHGLVADGNKALYLQMPKVDKSSGSS